MMTTGMTQLDPATMDEESGVSSDAVPPSKRGRSRLSILRLHTKVANTGSTARDHLANERTFLAWLRTGLSLLAVGLAFARFAHGWTAMLTGGLFVSLGAVFVAFSGWRYFQVRNDLMDDNFRCARTRAPRREGVAGLTRSVRISSCARVRGVLPQYQYGRRDPHARPYDRGSGGLLHSDDRVAGLWFD
jgi:putative membrane protein